MRELIELSAVDLLENQNARDLDIVYPVSIAPSEQELSLPDPDAQEMRDFRVLTDFHLQLVEASGNDWLIRIYKSITPTLARYQFFCCLPEIIYKGRKGHELILNSIKQGNYDQCKKMITNHIRFLLGHIEEAMTEKNEIKSGAIGDFREGENPIALAQYNRLSITKKI